MLPGRPEMNARPTTEELQQLVEWAAELVELDEIYLPIFERLDRELTAALARTPIERARARLAHRAIA